MVKVQITTAIELSSTQISTIEKALRSKMAKQELSFEYKVDPNILGGIRLIVGSREFDGTLQKRLEQIRQQLTSTV